MKYLDLTGLQYFYKKYIKTLGSAAKQTVANNLTTTAAGSVLDARQGKTLSEKITSETKTVGQRIERDANGKLFFRFSNNRPRSLEANGRLTAIIRHILGEY